MTNVSTPSTARISSILATASARLDQRDEYHQIVYLREVLVSAQPVLGRPMRSKTANANRRIAAGASTFGGLVGSVDERSEDAQRAHVEIEADLLFVDARQADDGRGRGIADGLQLRLDASGGLRRVLRVDDEKVKARVTQSSAMAGEPKRSWVPKAGLPAANWSLMRFCM